MMMMIVLLLGDVMYDSFSMFQRQCIVLLDGAVVVVILFSAFIVVGGCTFLAMGFLEVGAICSVVDSSSFTDGDFGDIVAAVGDAVYLAHLIAVVYSVFC